MKAIGTLTLLALIAGCLLTSLQLLTQDRIAQNQHNAEAQILAGLVDTTDPTLLEEQGIELLEVETRGYGGPMQIVVAVREDTILGVRILSHSETPGFSDVLKPSRWVGQFAELQLDEIDAVTGATITTSATLRAVRDAIRNREDTPQ